MEQDDGFEFGIGSLAQVEDVSVGTEAADDGGARRGVEGLAGGTDGDFAVVAYAHGGAQAPDVGPPRTGWGGAENGVVLSQSPVPGGLGRGAQFAVDFMGVGVGPELVEQEIGAIQLADLVGGQQGRQASLPVIVATFDFAFGLGGA
jgi:hypothetical protein